MLTCEKLVQETQILIQQAIRSDFSGFGLVLYRGLLEDLPVSPLIHNSELSPPIVNESEIVRFLLSISRYSDARHDGFHLVHELDGLNHLSQYISPPIPLGYKSEKYDVGARYRSAELGSLLKGVIAIIILGKDGQMSVFRNGVTRKIEHERT